MNDRHLPELICSLGKVPLSE